MCSGCGNCVVQFHTKPLSSFVIVSFLLSGAVGYSTYSAMSQEKPCTFPEDATWSFKIFCYIMLACAVVNLVFALFFQMQVWKQIKKLISEDYTANKNTNQTLEMQEESYASKLQSVGGDVLAQARQNAAQLGGTGTSPEEEEALEEEKRAIQHRVQSTTVQAGFKKTFMEDFGVLIFFLVSIGILVVCFMTKNQVVNEKSIDCSDKEWEGWACWTGMGFFTIPATYSFLWLCCGKCCAKAVPINQQDLDDLLGTGNGQE